MIFRPELIQAIREGRKTQTRRLKLEGDELTPKGVSASGRLRFRLGVHAVQPGRGKSGVEYIEVVTIWHELLQMISEDDAKAEGAFPLFEDGVPSYRAGFAALWDSILPPAKRWADNPSVWVLSFLHRPQSPPTASE